MQTPEEVAAMLRLKALGWGIKRIGRELGCSHMTVRHYVAQGGWVPYRGAGRPRALAGLEDWVAERFRRHAGNADVLRQELLVEKDIKLSLRTVEREVAPLRRELVAEAWATLRFETPPGRQMQIDFGERRALIDGESVKVYLFVATLGCSRRLYVRAFRNERQESWFAGLDGAFRHFGGVTEEVLFDNDRGLVVRHDRTTREVEFNARLHAFAKHWRFRPRACAPYRARTKGKDERGVGYVKKNAMPAAPSRAGRRWRPTLPPGRGTSPTSGWTARPARCRSNGSGVPRPAPCGRSPAFHPSPRRASWCARCRPIAPSRSTATPTRYHGG
jgi:transposase